jgi:hypothetical protein
VVLSANYARQAKSEVTLRAAKARRKLSQDLSQSTGPLLEGHMKVTDGNTAEGSTAAVDGSLALAVSGGGCDTCR